MSTENKEKTNNAPMACIENRFLLPDTFYSVISLNGICFRDILIEYLDGFLDEIMRQCLS